MQVIANLTEPPDEAVRTSGRARARSDIVFEGSFEEVNRLFYENRWSDGLPVVPPSVEQDRASSSSFTRPCAADARRSASCRPTTGTATVLECGGERRDGRLPAGIHAGAGGACRGDGGPREYGVEHSGNTPGAETLDYRQRPDRQGARLQLRAGRAQGRLPWPTPRSGASGGSISAMSRASSRMSTDKGTFGNTWRVVARRERGRARSGSAGSQHGEPTSGSCRKCANADHRLPLYRRRCRHFRLRADRAERDAALSRRMRWSSSPAGSSSSPSAWRTGTYRPLLVLSPILAETIAGSGLVARTTCKRLALRACADAGLEVRGGISRAEYTNLVPGHRSLTELVAVGQGAGGLRRVRRPGADGAPRLRAGRHPRRGDRRPASHQRLRVRAQRHARLPGREAGRAAGGLEEKLLAARSR